MPIDETQIPELTDDIRAELKAKFIGVQLEVIKHPDLPYVAVVRPATEGEWRIYRNMQQDDAPAASVMLADSCVVWPPKPARDAIVKAYPGLRDTWSLKISAITGATASATREKL